MKLIGLKLIIKMNDFITIVFPYSVPTITNLNALIETTKQTYHTTIHLSANYQTNTKTTYSIIIIGKYNDVMLSKQMIHSLNPSFVIH